MKIKSLKYDLFNSSVVHCEAFVGFLWGYVCICQYVPMKVVSGLYFECKSEVFTRSSSIHLKLISQNTKLPTSEKRDIDKHIDTLLTFELKSLMSQRGLIFLMLNLLKIQTASLKSKVTFLNFSISKFRDSNVRFYK